MYRKIISIFLIVLLALGFTGCSMQNNKLPVLDPNNPVNITIWHYYSGIQKDAFDKIVAEFNDSLGRDKGIIVESISQGGVNELRTNF
jgi:multiple sugar transport system substrate-binding protein